MKKRKPNTESTVKERLRLVVGTIMLFAGLFIATVIGSLSDYSDTTTWVVGIGLMIGGVVTANSYKLIEHISGF